MLSCSIWFSEPSFWMGGVLESCCVGRLSGADGGDSAVRAVILALCALHFVMCYTVLTLQRLRRY